MEDYEATNCNEQVPVFGLWSRSQELQGFGFSVPGTTINQHFENPPSLAVSVSLTMSYYFEHLPQSTYIHYGFETFYLTHSGTQTEPFLIFNNN